MSNIQISNMTFEYEGAIEPIFENVNLTLDTDWKLGLIGRNGRGKTTFLKLLLGKYEYKGMISKSVDCEYFPFTIKNTDRATNEILEELLPNVEQWQVIKELNLLNVDIGCLYRNYETLSGGEKIKIMLAILFLKENNFLLIDEPTNHLDIEARKNIQEYLKKKKGFILVSHDRNLLDEVVDHIVSINQTDIEVVKGNFSTWKENKDNQDEFEKRQNENLKSDITRLEEAKKNTSNWSAQIEKSKKGDGHVDTGYIGHMAAKMMKRSKSMGNRTDKMIKQKEGLLKNIEKQEDLVIKPLEYYKKELVIAKDFKIKYDDQEVFLPIDFELERGDRIAIKGKNGSGKSSILKLICGEEIQYDGNFKIGNNIKISYVSQSTEHLKGTLHEIAIECKIDEGIFKAMLSKLGVSNKEFDKPIQNLSQGQKKKVLLAKSITESADLYVWDEPLNYIDIFSRIQLEDAILKYKPTMIFVEHDEKFTQKIATKTIKLK